MGDAIGAAVSGIAGAAQAAGGVASTASTLASLMPVIGTGMKALGGIVKGVTGSDDQHMKTNPLTPDQSSVAHGLAGSFGLSGEGQQFQAGGAGTGAPPPVSMAGRVQRLASEYAKMRPPQTAGRFNLAGRGY